EAALAGYEAQRNAASMEQFRQNLHLAQFKPMPAEAMLLRQKLRDRPADTHAFYLANQGMLPRETFFTPENMQRIMAA
ncbi:MAG: hypothetical protein KDE47_32995, partial [Caldilineaceae bacterium]|nr:hypothetical protein [Caldilineaceae bacterium]